MATAQITHLFCTYEEWRVQKSAMILVSGGEPVLVNGAVILHYSQGQLSLIFPQPILPTSGPDNGMSRPLGRHFKLCNRLSVPSL
jgi:hypothetical protein